ncbi:MAG: four helix bundle protein [Desulfovibrionaceae bacterium]
MLKDNELSALELADSILASVNAIHRTSGDKQDVLAKLRQDALFLPVNISEATTLDNDAEKAMHFTIASRAAEHVRHDLDLAESSGACSDWDARNLRTMIDELAQRLETLIAASARERLASRE